MGSARLKAWVAAIALLATLVISTPAGAADRVCWQRRPAEGGFTRQINAARSAAGLGTLRLDPELSRAARVHTWAMANQNRLYHTPEWRLTKRVTRWVILGENVGVGENVDSLHQAFMASAAHRANVMHATFKNVGVGTLYRGGRLWVTVVFEGVTDPGTTLKMPRC